MVKPDNKLFKCTAMSALAMSRTSAEFAYTVELPDDGRQYGFLLPSDQAPRVGDEVWAAVQTLTVHILANTGP